LIVRGVSFETTTTTTTTATATATATATGRITMSSIYHRVPLSLSLSLFVSSLSFARSHLLFIQ